MFFFFCLTFALSTGRVELPAQGQCDQESTQSQESKSKGVNYISSWKIPGNPEAPAVWNAAEKLAFPARSSCLHIARHCTPLNTRWGKSQSKKFRLRLQSLRTAVVERWQRERNGLLLRGREGGTASNSIPTW